MIRLLKKYWKWWGTLLLAFLLYFIFCLPKPLFDTPYSVVIEDQEQNLLGALIAKDGQWRFPQSTEAPPLFEAAIIEFEDRRFYRHPGIDIRALVRAMNQNIRNGRIVSGGSTLSMQVIRLAQQNPKRSLFNKLKEIVMALRLELSYSKKEILLMYCAHAPFGGNVVGLDAAAWRYYGKSAQLLSWSEAATLAVLPNSPGLIHPGRNRAALQAKRNRLLQRLFDKQQIDAIELELALEEDLPDQPLALPQHVPHLLQRLAQDYKAGLVQQPRVQSTIDLALQSAANRRMEQYQLQMAKNEIHNAAALILHIPSNTIRAYIGNAPGAGTEHGEMVDIIRAPRSTGSILKPFLYSMALEAGTILPQSLLSDTPVNFNGYRPENYKQDYNGAVPADEALARSLNIPFVNLLKNHGLEKFHLELQQLGMSTLHNGADHYGLTLILGGAEANLEEMTNLYARLGRTLSLYSQNSSQYLKKPKQDAVFYTDQQENGLEIDWQKEPSTYGAAAAWYTLKAMQEVKRPDTEGEWQTFRSGRRIAWKTGTSFGFRDAWAIGLTPEYAVGVWVGNADGEGRPGLVGVQAAGPLLFDLFRLLPNTSWFTTPFDDLKPRAVCAQSGYLARSFCPKDSLLIPAGLEQQQICTYHHRLFLDTTEQFQVTSECASPFEMKAASWFILPPLEAHYYRRYKPDYRTVPPFDPKCLNGLERSPMQMVYPREKTQIYVPIDLDGQLSRTVFEVAHNDEAAVLHWHIDNEFIGTTRQFHSMEFNPAAGIHQLTIVDQAGNRLEQTFEIIAK